MSKNKSTPVASAPTKKHLSRMERDRRLRRYVGWGMAVVVGFVVLVIGAALLDVFVLQPSQPVARVGDQNITSEEFQKAVRYRRFQLLQQYAQIQQYISLFGEQGASFFQSQLSQVESQLSAAYATTLGREVLNSLIDDRLIRAEAARRGVTVSAEEVEARLREQFGFFPDGTPTPSVTPPPLPTDAAPTVDPTRAARWTPTATLTPTTPPTATPEPTFTPTPSGPVTPTATPTPYTTQIYGTEVAGAFGNVRQATGLTDADIRKLIESELYREKVQAAITADVPATALQTRARHILVADEASALAALARYEAGEDWAALARELSTDTSNAGNGGDLGWFTRDVMVEPFANAAFSATVGSITGPVQTQFGWHLIQVLGREERPLDAQQLQANRQNAFDAWLAGQRGATQPDGQPLVQTFDVWTTRVPTTPGLNR